MADQRRHHQLHQHRHSPRQSHRQDRTHQRLRLRGCVRLRRPRWHPRPHHRRRPLHRLRRPCHQLRRQSLHRHTHPRTTTRLPRRTDPRSSHPPPSTRLPRHQRRLHHRRPPRRRSRHPHRREHLPLRLQRPPHMDGPSRTTRSRPALQRRLQLEPLRGRQLLLDRRHDGRRLYLPSSAMGLGPPLHHRHLRRHGLLLRPRRRLGRLRRRRHRRGGHQLPTFHTTTGLGTSTRRLHHRRSTERRTVGTPSVWRSQRRQSRR